MLWDRPSVDKGAARSLNWSYQYAEIGMLGLSTWPGRPPEGERDQSDFGSGAPGRLGQRRSLSLGDHRPALRGDGDQLRRSPDDRFAEARPLQAVRLVGDRLCQPGVLFSVLLRRGLCRLGQSHGQHRSPLGLRGRIPDLADRAHRPRRSTEPQRVHLRPRGAGRRRGRRLPCGHQGRGRVVPQEGARPGHRRFQCGHQHRRDRHAAGGPECGVRPTAGKWPSSSPVSQG